MNPTQENAIDYSKRCRAQASKSIKDEKMKTEMLWDANVKAFLSSTNFLHRLTSG